MIKSNTRYSRLVADAISLPFSTDPAEAFEIAKKKLKKAGLPYDASVKYSVYRRSIDARRKDDIRFVYSILVEVLDSIEIDSKRLLTNGFRTDRKSVV